MSRSIDPATPRTVAVPQHIREALHDERQRGALQVGVYRFYGVSSFYLLSLVLGLALGLPAWRGNLDLFTAYWLCSMFLAWAARYRPWAASLNWYALGAVDVPVIFWLQVTTLSRSDASGVAGFTVGIYLFLIMLAALSLEVAPVIMTLATGAVCEVWLQTLAQVSSGGRVAAVVLLGLGGACSTYGRTRLLHLLGRLMRATDEGRLMLERLGHTERTVALSQLARGVVHELSNPLAAITMNLHFAAEHLLDCKPEVREAIEESITSCERVAFIAQSMAVFARDDEAVLDLISLRDAVEQAASFTQPVWRMRAQLITDLQPTPPVRGNLTRMAQVFANLLINAAHSFTSERAGSNEIRLKLWHEGGRVTVEVRDNGRGISDEDQSRIFDPFFTTQGPGGGAGLGLSIAQGIVGAVGGEIQVESRVGEGSVFRVTFPVAPAT
jgi:signal transduction histidine kinase